MELVKKNIHMNKLKCKSNLQLTLDDDFNVPDVKPDIGRMITEQGEVKISDIRAMNGKLLVKGALVFNVLYLCDGDQVPIHNISGEIPFDEAINMDITCSDDEPNVKWELEDLNTSMIHSRKISVRAIVGLYVAVEELYDEETAVGVDSSEDVQYINKKIEVTDVAINKKDTYRIKDEIMLPANKGNIANILYQDIGLSNVEIRLLEDRFTIKGEIPVFIFYISDGEENSMEYYETEVPFSGTIECNGCSEDMVEDIMVSIANKHMEIKPDSDGEERILDLEVMLELGIRVYETQEPEILCDVYCPSKEITPIMRNANYENLVVKNNSKYRVADRIFVSDNQPRILQICHATGVIRIDDITSEGSELMVEGVIEVSILYISEDDARPMNSIKGMIPFSQIIELKGMKPGCNYEIKPTIDQLSVMMLDGEEIEVKATINLNTIVFELISEPIITDIEVSDLDMEKLQAMPGVIGYVVKKGDTLWKVAKKYYTTVDNIMTINHLEDEHVKEGEKLIILKKVDAVL